VVLAVHQPPDQADGAAQGHSRAAAREPARKEHLPRADAAGAGGRVMGAVSRGSRATAYRREAGSRVLSVPTLVPPVVAIAFIHRAVPGAHVRIPDRRRAPQTGVDGRAPPRWNACV